MTDENLFDLDNKEMIKIIRQRWRTLQLRKKFMWRGQRYYRQYLEATPDYSPGTWTPATLTTPQDICIANDMVRHIQKKLNQQENFVFNKLNEGYRVMEIGPLIEESASMTKYHSMNLKRKVKQVL